MQRFSILIPETVNYSSYDSGTSSAYGALLTLNPYSWRTHAYPKGVENTVGQYHSPIITPPCPPF